MTKAEDGLSYAEVIKIMSQSKAKDKMINELYYYVSTGVTQLSGGKQHPVMWGSFPDTLVIVKFGKKLSHDRDK